MKKNCVKPGERTRSLKGYRTGSTGIFLLAFVSATLSLSSCTWVRLERGADRVNVIDAKDVSSCKKNGETSVKVVGKVLGIKRNEKKVKQELTILAKNSASDMGGDSILATGPVKTGRQKFFVYNCNEQKELKKQ
ncbi:MAG: DUF4156 domain-containing protein [Nitrospinota bacterium]